MYFQSRKLTNIFYFGGRFIHALMPLQCICVYNRIGRTQLGNYLFFGFQSEWNDCLQDCLRAVCAVNFSRDQSSDKLINFLDSQLDTRDSRLDPRGLDTRNYWGSSLEGLSTYFWAVLSSTWALDCATPKSLTYFYPSLAMLFHKNSRTNILPYYPFEEYK